MPIPAERRRRHITKPPSAARAVPNRAKLVGSGTSVGGFRTQPGEPGIQGTPFPANSNEPKSDWILKLKVSAPPSRSVPRSMLPLRPGRTNWNVSVFGDSPGRNRPPLPPPEQLLPLPDAPQISSVLKPGKFCSVRTVKIDELAVTPVASGVVLKPKAVNRTLFQSDKLNDPCGVVLISSSENVSV